LPNLGFGLLTVQVSVSHTIRHTQPVGLIWTGDQPVAKAATYTTNTTDERPYIYVRIRTRSLSNRTAIELRLRQRPLGPTE